MILAESVSKFTVRKLEDGFYRWGLIVASHPFWVIAAATLVTSLCCIGLRDFKTEADGEKLWLPDDSVYTERKRWKSANLDERTRGHVTMLGHPENVLTPEALLRVLEFHTVLRGVVVDGQSFEDFCHRIPVADITLAKKKRRRRRRRRKRQDQEDGTFPYNGTDPASGSGDSEYDEQDYFNFYDFTATLEGNDTPNENAEEINDDSSEELIEDLPRSIYCDLVTTLKERCNEHSILAIWKYDEEVIRGLKQQDIIDAVNTVDKSPLFGTKTDYTGYLGGKVRNSSGSVVAATTLLDFWTTEWNPARKVNTSRVVGLDLDLADPLTMEWERRVVEKFEGLAEEIESEGSGLFFLPFIKRSFADVSSEAVELDLPLVGVGYFLMFTYTMIMLGKINMVEHRAYLAVAGIFSVVMGVMTSLGLSSALGFPFTTIHGILPFLALGIGIDDMFVIMQCHENQPLMQGEKHEPHKRIATTMKHAGVAITVTSLTDVFAFGVGAFTILPGLQSFCVCCAFAIGAIFLLQSSWFVAWLAIDQMRIDSLRDGFAPCYVHKDWTPSECSQRKLGSVVMAKAADLYQRRWAQAAVILSTLTLLGFGIWGASQMYVEFDPVLLLPTDSYLRRFYHQKEVDFPTSGWGGRILVGNFNISKLEDLENLVRLREDFKALHVENGGNILDGSGFWWNGFEKYLGQEKNVTDWRDSFESGKLSLYLSDFFFSSEGAQDRVKLVFEGELACNENIPPIRAAEMGSITYRPFTTQSEKAAGKAAVDSVVGGSNLSDAFIDTVIYAAWETDEIIGRELGRNLALAMVCVFVVSLVMLANLFLTVMTLVCVVMTLVDVIGMLFFWGMTIDTISCMCIVLIVGLCVDYSVHIAHAFSVAQGETGGEKARVALTTMGPAILNGGTTTWLALIVLAFSNSYGFIVMFRIFLLSVVFGLFHGLAFLPVTLIVLGGSFSSMLQLNRQTYDVKAKHQNNGALP